MEKEKARRFSALCSKIVPLVLVLTPLAFFSYRLIEGRIYDLADMGNDGYHSGFGLYIFLSHIALLVVNIVLILVGVIKSILVKRKENDRGKKNAIIEFRFLTFAPACSQMLYLVITAVALSIG